jgi:hypothetical protein
MMKGRMAATTCAMNPHMPTAARRPHHDNRLGMMGVTRKIIILIQESVTSKEE